MENVQQWARVVDLDMLLGPLVMAAAQRCQELMLDPEGYSWEKQHHHLHACMYAPSTHSWGWKNDSNVHCARK